MADLEDRPVQDLHSLSQPRSQAAGLPPSLRPQLRLLATSAAVLALCFSLPLYHWVRFAVHSQLYSHVILIPFISLYLVWLKKRDLPPVLSPPRSRQAL